MNSLQCVGNSEIKTNTSGKISKLLRLQKAAECKTGAGSVLYLLSMRSGERSFFSASQFWP